MSATAARLLYVGELRSGPRLRDTGHEVVVLDPAVTPAELAAVVVQEDVSVVAVTDAELGAAAVASLDDDVVVFCITWAEGHS